MLLMTLFSINEFIIPIFNIYLFSSNQSFSVVGYVSAIYILGMSVLNYSFVYVKDARNRKKMATLAGVVQAVVIIGLIFANSYSSHQISNLHIGLSAFLLGLVYPIMNIYSMEKSMEVGKELDIRRELVFYRDIGFNLGPGLFTIVALPFIGLTPFLIVSALGVLACGTLNKFGEDKFLK